MGTESFQRFLEDQRARGAFDSSGRFCIDWSRAQLKLGRFQMAHPAGYLLKLVQAGVRLGASLIRIELKRDSLRLELDGVELGCGQVVELFARPLSGDAHDALALLAAGLNAAPASQIEFFDHQRGQGVRLAQEPESLVVEPGRSACSLIITRKADSGQRAAEHEALSKRLTFSPVPVYLDARQLTLRSEAPFYQAFPRPDESLVESGMLLGEWLGPGQGLGIPAACPALVLEGYTRLRTEAKRPNLFLRLVEAGEGGAGSTVIIPFALAGPSHVYLVQYGVAIDILERRLPCPGARAALCLDGWASDLSGFAIRDQEALARELEQLDRLCRHLAERVAAELDSLEVVLSERDFVLEKAFLGASLGLGLGLCFGPAGLLMGAVAKGAAAGVAAGVIGKLAGRHQARVEKYRQTILQRLPGGSSGQS
ncbi:MAG: hypothetical protein KC910_00310 [Candidatus Eremiobacteraeota bacterium]|nr:hypothetical protein [Candidatus Eremiobacteraeota bacterium]